MSRWGFECEGVGIEPVVIFRLRAALPEAAGPRVGKLERTHRIRAIPAVVEDEGIASQRPEGRLVDLDGESGLEGGDAGDLPSVSEPARHFFERVELADAGQVVHIADHKALARIESGAAVVAGDIEGIDARARKGAVLQAGRIVEGVAPRVRSLERQTVGSALVHAGLEGVVVRVEERGL